MKTSDFKSTILSLQTSLFSFAMKLTSNSNDASDLVQDTNLRALDNKESFAEGTNLKGWVFTIMRNTFLNNMRGASRKCVVSDSATEDCNYALNIVSEAPTPDSVYAAREIGSVISSLPEAERLPFTMLMEGYSYQEIGKKLGIPANIVKSRIFHTRKKLRSVLREN